MIVSRVQRKPSRGPGFIGERRRDAARPQFAHSQASTASAQRRPSSIAQTIERLPPACVARGEDAGHARRVRRRGDVAARVPLDAERIEQRRLRADEAHREQHELGRPRLLGSRHRRERRRAAVLQPVDALDALAAREAGGRDREAALAAFLQRVRRAELHRPERPRRQSRPSAAPAARRAARSASPTPRPRGARSRRSRRRCRRRRSRSRACRAR